VRDFFISYNKADKPWAEWIDRELRAAGCTTVIQANDFGPGCNFILEMQKATEEAERTIAVLSPAYLGALYTQPEWAAAFAKDPTGEKRLFVPIRVAPCQLKGMLANVVYMDLVGLDEAAAREALLDCLLPSRQPGKVKGAFPGAAGTKAPRFPGALPPIWNVPHRRNPNFTGREEELAELSKTLAKGGTAALTQAITGLGGVGKTQLAIEYVYRHVSDYGLIWWVGAEVPAKRAADFAALAAPLDLREKDSANQPEIVGAVRRELGRRTRWLLVFDDAGAPEDLADYLPQGTAGHVVVTSRNPAWASLGKPLPVKTLPGLNPSSSSSSGAATKMGRRPMRWPRPSATCLLPWSTPPHMSSRRAAPSLTTLTSTRSRAKNSAAGPTPRQATRPPWPRRGRFRSARPRRRALPRPSC